MFFKAAALLALVPFAFAGPQYDYPPAVPAPTSSSVAPAPTSNTLASGGQILVQVAAGGQFVFQPSNIQAPVGTLVTFAFPGTLPHSVTQTSANEPCTPASGGFDSGLQGNAGVTYSVNVTDASQPIYFMCKFPAHCGLGMVGTINAPNSGNGSFASFQAAAQAIGANEPNVQDNGPVTGGVNGAIATALPTTGTPSVSGAASQTSSPSSPSQTGSSGSSGAAQLTINAGLGLAVLAAGAILAL